MFTYCVHTFTCSRPCDCMEPVSLEAICLAASLFWHGFTVCMDTKYSSVKRFNRSVAEDHFNVGCLSPYWKKSTEENFLFDFNWVYWGNFKLKNEPPSLHYQPLWLDISDDTCQMRCELWAITFQLAYQTITVMTGMPAVVAACESRLCFSV